MLPTPNTEERDVHWLLDFPEDLLNCPKRSLEASFADIPSLPIEVWRLIVERCVLEQQDLFRQTPWYSLEDNTIDTQTLISLTHACQLLRRIVLAMPHLWSELDMGKCKNQVEAFVERSRGSLLVIILPAKRILHGYLPQEEEVDILTDLSKMGDRIRAITGQIRIKNHHLIKSWLNLAFLYRRFDFSWL
jgi:hypothetical protein